MKVTWLDAAQQRPRHIALGQFDGVHLGHREVIRHGDTVVTFEPHPQIVLSPDRPPRLLCDLEHKLELMRQIGVAEVVLVPFDAARARQAPGDFVSEVLVERLWARHVAVGANFRFGRRAAGDSATLAADRRFTAVVVPLLTIDGDVVSSSRIRRLVATGDLAAAERLLGSAVQLAGTVHALTDDGQAIARFDPGAALPPAGVYRCTVGARGEATLRLGSADATGSEPVEGVVDPGRAAVGDVIRLDLHAGAGSAPVAAVSAAS